jgi:hypothetical protein
MKKLVLCVIALAAVNLSANAQIEMNSVGNVGIGTTPLSNNKLTIGGNSVTFYNNGYPAIEIKNGYYNKILVPTSNNTCTLGASGQAFSNIYTYALTNYSDARGKENIKNIKGALGVVLKLQGVTYDLKREIIFPDSFDKNNKDEKYKERKIRESKDQIGFIAQEVEKVIPNAVSYDDSTDVYGINYIKIIPILVEAMKEQQILIEEMASEIKSLKTSKTQKNAEIGGETSTQQQNQLFQNTPNPFTKSTEIKYAIADNVKNAMLNIYNMNGTQLKSIPINQTGMGTVTINGNEFGAGMYM